MVIKNLPVTALVMDKLDCDILGGVPFCKDNDISVHLKDELLSVQGINLPYGANCSNASSEVYQATLRNDNAKVLFPGDFVEMRDESLKLLNGEIAIEPRMDSPADGNWPLPSISRSHQWDSTYTEHRERTNTIETFSTLCTDSKGCFSQTPQPTTIATIPSTPYPIMNKTWSPR